MLLRLPSSIDAASVIALAVGWFAEAGIEAMGLGATTPRHIGHAAGVLRTRVHTLFADS